jgi:hypothetical protein
MALQSVVERRKISRRRDRSARIQGAGKTNCAGLVPRQCRRTQTALARCFDAKHKSLVSLQNPNARRNGDALGTAFAQ